jgi:hypothetical protein
MTEHTNHEVPWVGMDVDAELARYAEEDRRREQPEPPAAPTPKRSSQRRGLRVSLPTLHWEGTPASPLAA